MSAFDLLMQKKPKRKRPSPFFDCPAGCGARLLEWEINRHLDDCLNSDKTNDDHSVGPQKKKHVPPPKEGPAAITASQAPRNSRERVNCPSCQKSLPHSMINLHLDYCSSSKQESPLKKTTVSLSAGESALQPSSTKCVGDAETLTSSDVASPSPGNDTDNLLPVPRVSQSPRRIEKPLDKSDTPVEKRAGSNIFTKMIENSKKTFARLVTQSFHLNEKNEVSLRLNTLPINEILLSSRWSAMVTVKDKCEQDTPRLSFEVHLSSSISCDPIQRRWIHRHSRLSIPVLKSLLQKSIRRRRPLDSVRIAMEIADKALDELLRRLPIIILEDSTLHEDLPFLIWAMMAQSKGFSPPTSMMMRIFRIIFEVASCPRRDSLLDDSSEHPTTLTLLYNDNEAAEATRSQSLVWAMLVRAEYGGMKGDVAMLRRFANVWANRFSESSLPIEVTQAVTKSKPSIWLDIPSALHAQAKEHSEQQVGKLLQPPVSRLCTNNFCPEGIDFHCSSVLDALMSDKALVALCHDLLLLSGSDVTTLTNASYDDTIQRVENLARHCIWVYSAGVNRRLPLIQNADKDQEVRDNYKNLWVELLAPRVLKFQQQYINQRLAH